MSERKAPILVVEDDAANQLLIKDVLECSGYRCEMVNNAEECLRLAETLQPVLIMLDIKLPGMDGVTAAQLLRKSPPTRAIPLIGMSAHALINEMSHIESAKFDYFITKPFSYKALLGVVQDALAGKPGS
jgi:two-component system cell cycle response regulator DivK